MTPNDFISDTFMEYLDDFFITCALKSKKVLNCILFKIVPFKFQA